MKKNAGVVDGYRFHCNLYIVEGILYNRKEFYQIKTLTQQQNCYKTTTITESFLCILSFYTSDSKIKICITILPATLYSGETLSFILKEEHRLREFKNKVLRRLS
jgi:hypothetical protein